MAALQDWLRSHARVVDVPAGLSAADATSGASAAAAPEAAETPADPVQDPPGVLLVSKLQTASEWAAGGFVVLSSLLLFFGIKDGVLDQLLRRYPLPVLCVFALLGIGVLTSLFAPAVRAEVRVRWWAVLAPVGLMLGVAAHYLPDLAAQEAGSPSAAMQVLDAALTLAAWGAVIVSLALLGWLLDVDGGSRTARAALVVAVLVGLAALVFQPWADAAVSAQSFFTTLLVLALVVLGAVALATKAALPAVAALVIVGVVSTSLGLYGATKLAVHTKVVSGDPQVTAVLTTAGDAESVLTLTAKASRMSDEALLVHVAGTPRWQQAPVRDGGAPPPRAGDGRREHEVWRAVLEPDGLDEIDRTVAVHVDPDRWEFVTVRQCTVDTTGGRARKAAADSVSAPVTLLGAAMQAPCAPGTVREVTRLRNAQAEAGAQLTGHLAAVDDVMQVHLAATGVADGTVVRAEVRRVAAGAEASTLTTATLSPSEAGAVSWDPSVAMPATGEELVLQAALCLPGQECAEPGMRELARYTGP